MMVRSSRTMTNCYRHVRQRISTVVLTIDVLTASWLAIHRNTVPCNMTTSPTGHDGRRSGARVVAQPRWHNLTNKARANFLVLPPVLQRLKPDSRSGCNPHEDARLEHIPGAAPEPRAPGPRPLQRQRWGAGRCMIE